MHPRFKAKTMKISMISFVIYIVGAFFTFNESWFLLYFFGGAVIVACIWTYFFTRFIWESPPLFDSDIFGIEERNRLLREIRDELKNR